MNYVLIHFTHDLKDININLCTDRNLSLILLKLSSTEPFNSESETISSKEG